jgi:serine/threonine protein kinase
MGITVFSLLHEHKEELNEMRKIDLLLQIASGMCYLHCKYIVHLDLVMICKMLYSFPNKFCF